MNDQLSAREFLDALGVEDWRVVGESACAYFRTGSFATGAALVSEIARLAELANHHPDVDLRYAGLTVRLWSHDVASLSQRDVALARAVSRAARELATASDPSALQTLQLTIDAVDVPRVRAFWRALLDYHERGDDDLLDARGRGPSLWFQQVAEARTERSRLHVDLALAHDQVESRIEAALATGGRLVTDTYAPRWWVLADCEGNEACLVTWHDLD